MKYLTSILLTFSLICGIPGTSAAHAGTEEPEQKQTQSGPPVYKNGGDSGMLRDLARNIAFPVTDKPLSGRLVMKFPIDYDGKIVHDSIKVVRNLSDLPQEYIDAAVRAIKMLGDFTPPQKAGKEVYDKSGRLVTYICWMTVPVNFVAPKEQPKMDSWQVFKRDHRR